MLLINLIVESIKQILKKEEAVDSLEEIILSTTVHAQVEELAMIVLKKLDSEHWKRKIFIFGFWFGLVILVFSSYPSSFPCSNSF